MMSHFIHRASCTTRTIELLLNFKCVSPSLTRTSVNIHVLLVNLKLCCSPFKPSPVEQIISLFRHFPDMNYDYFERAGAWQSDPAWVGERQVSWFSFRVTLKSFSQKKKLSVPNDREKFPEKEAAKEEDSGVDAGIETFGILLPFVTSENFHKDWNSFALSGIYGQAKPRCDFDNKFRVISAKKSSRRKISSQRLEAVNKSLEFFWRRAQTPVKALKRCAA